MNRRLATALLSVWFVLAFAQLPLQVTFPNGSALQVSVQQIDFDLSKGGFPPRELPAYFYPDGDSRKIRLKLFSNIAEAWVLAAEVTPLTSRSGVWLPPERIEVKVDGGPWLPLGSRTRLIAGYGPTGGYQEHWVRVRLKVVGDEPAGQYQGVIVFSLSRL